MAEETKQRVVTVRSSRQAGKTYEMMKFWEAECQRITQEYMTQVAILHQEIYELKTKLVKAQAKLEALESAEKREMIYG